MYIYICFKQLLNFCNKIHFTFLLKSKLFVSFLIHVISPQFLMLFSNGNSVILMISHEQKRLFYLVQSFSAFLFLSNGVLLDDQALSYHQNTFRENQIILFSCCSTLLFLESISIEHCFLFFAIFPKTKGPCCSQRWKKCADKRQPVQSSKRIEAWKLSKPTFNQQLNSTEFEVRLHSYPVIHPPPPPTPHKLFVVVVNCPSQTVQLYSHSQPGRRAA